MLLNELKQQVFSYRQATRWVVGLSGGVDSLVLLHALTQLKADYTLPQLVALHVNHHLQPGAAAWAEQCRLFAERLAVDFDCLSVDIDTGINGSNLEAKAREARYTAFSNWLQSDDLLLLAHHQMDQTETFLYRLLRGAGIKGLAAIPRLRNLGSVQLFRPLLACPKSDIMSYAKAHGLTPVEDPSNSNLRFDRNYIRHEILPVLLQRWPQVCNRIDNTIDHINEACGLLDELAQQDLAVIDNGDDFEPWIDWQQIGHLSSARQKNLLKYWFGEHQVILEAKHWPVLFTGVLGAKVDAVAELSVADSILRRHRNRLYLTRLASPEDKIINWNIQYPLRLKGYPALVASHPQDLELQVKFRTAGERVVIASNRPEKKIKTLLHELNVPYWRRDHIPLIYYHNQLIAIGEKLRCEAADLTPGKVIIICAK